MKEFFLEDETSGMGRKKLESRENRFDCVRSTLSLNLQPEQGENILRFGSCVIVGRVLNFFPSNSSFLFFSVSPSLLTVKNPRRRQTVWVGKNILETFETEKKKNEKNYFYVLFYPKKEETPERVKPLNRQDVREENSPKSKGETVSDQFS